MNPDGLVLESTLLTNQLLTFTVCYASEVIDQPPINQSNGKWSLSYVKDLGTNKKSL